MSTSPPRSTPALAAAAVLLLGGCAATPTVRDPVEADASPSDQDARSSPPPADPAPPEAADGTDLEACADADCEVLVEEGDEFAMDGTYGVDRFVVDAVDEEGLSVSGHGAGVMLSGHLPPPDGEEPHHSFVMNGFTIVLVTLDGAGALIRLSP
ncbi:hypothetical protein HNR06_000549 [Nocardiopsis arvandica]|uniref:Uncharacterized protein n=1 Tax=Nocardiopsis sinuspersici TaxID=501010 RepID=A0A7Y9XB07_9ACTN|nr:hypothetical protein [Nocardiopsis sinuspersici]NYH50960.1 hypothetical protein [Nocardiopsis sinuspersici]